jgi:hypothetical protein
MVSFFWSHPSGLLQKTIFIFILVTKKLIQKLHLYAVDVQESIESLMILQNDF